MRFGVQSLTDTARSPPSLAGDPESDRIRGIVRDRSGVHGQWIFGASQRFLLAAASDT
jgi:hypothetical protein